MTTWRAASDPYADGFAVAIVLAGLALAPAARAADPESATTFLEDEAGYYLVSLVERDVYLRELTYEVSFKGAVEVDMQTGTDEDGNPVFESRSVAALSELDPAAAVLLACVDEVCRPVDASQDLIGTLGEGHPETAIRFALAPGARLLQRGEDLRLLAKQGWVRLGEEGGTSPAVSVTLPRLSERDQTVLGSQPLLRLGLAPIAEDADSDESGSGLTFDGGLYRFRRSYRLGLHYNGTVSTEERVGFDSVQLEGDFERNLLAGRRDYLPLKLALAAESDQDFDLVNGLVRASLEFVLPWNANYSPRGDGYIPNTGPLVRVTGEVGTRLDEDETNAASVASPEHFRRAGYDIHWRLPVARDSVLRLHHAGLWVFSSDLPEDDFHSLWDVALETRIGALTYYIGYQQGEAAPLFTATETTQVGVLVRLGQRFQCQSGNGKSHWVCSKP